MLHFFFEEKAAAMIKNYPVILIIAGISVSACLPAVPPAGGGVQALMKDGYYTAEVAEFDGHGWKEYVTICVSGGKIITVEYNAYNRSGFIKSWDMDYMRSMNSRDGTYPNEYTRIYAGRLLRGQGTEHIDGIAGATASYHSFILLAGAAIKNARTGRTVVSLVGPAENPEGP
jgi:major membrane immunogen (membrane-anchored lipoprotein)